MADQNLQNFSLMHEEPAWLSDLRQKAMTASAELNYPNIERVRFSGWKLDTTEIGDLDFSGNVPDFSALGEHPMVVQVGSQTLLEQLPADLAAKGVVFTDFHSALSEIPEVMEKYFAQAIKFDEDKLAATSTAAFNSGVVLYIPDNVEIDQPVETILQQDSKSSLPFNKRVLIIAGRNTKLDYLERLDTVGDGNVKAIANFAVEVIAEDGAQIKYSAIDRLGKNVTGYISRRGYIKNNATINWSLAVMNDGNVICDFDSDLKGDGSHAELKAVGISMGKQIQGVDTRVTNFGRNSIGHILQHGVILEKGTLTFNGIGHIIKGAKGADAQQESRVLMLSDQARSDANPILLIDENDVTAGHAASIGQVDPEDMYYLMSRGLDEVTAKRLVIRGFLGSVVSNIPLKAVRDEFIASIDRKLDL
ncbi:Fe-S cluster assembly protein SufD [Lactococcus termiticola]|uniref:Fe-S cluster assembly protein SufD n=1 Tax=Lactococcus termiticola TaxID=2169526 RepID=A0A2R5HJX5_9LACT|nr:Fe-S cluster assembly protein SufD [Lactococcus termiticola]GBG97008.1 Fe-S cluster assembly protein SufD [Lactococcus termiticola]